MDVIRAVARASSTPGADDEAILLQTMRALATHAATSITQQNRAKLRKLPLWTSDGWKRDRPVYATDDPVLAEGLRDRLPFWEPGGELQQFRSLLDPLRVEEIQATAAEVIQPGLAAEHEESSALFRSALQHLQEDLTRNDPRLAQSIRVPWQVFKGFKVYVHPSLLLGVSTGRFSYQCKVMAKVDRDRDIVFVESPAELTRVDSGGRAIATLFEGNPRQLAQAWRAASDRAESGSQARLIELAEQRSKREQDKTESEIAGRTTEVRERIAATQQPQDRSGGRGQIASGSWGATDNGRESQETLAKLEPPRVLVNPESLDIVDPQGRLESSEQRGPHKTGRDGSLVEPRPADGGPRGRSPVPLYSDLEKEDVGLALLRKLLSSDHDEIADLRAQRGVGADAVDQMQRFYELKVSAGAEPDQVTLTGAEMKRASSDPNFFLVVVSGIEGVDARPKVRVIVDPLGQLPPTEGGSITLSGVRSATSLTYDFARIDGSVPARGAEELSIRAD